MKILLIGAHFPPEFTGGSEVVLDAQARELARTGARVRILCGTDEPLEERPILRELAGELELARLPRDEGERRSVDWLHPRITGLVLDELADADVVHLHHWALLSGDLVRRIRVSRPVVVTLHDHFAVCPRYFRTPREGISCPASEESATCAACLAPEVPGIEPAALARKLGERFASFRAEIEAASRVIAPSRYVRDSMARILGLDPGRWHLVPHGLCRPLAPLMREGGDRGPLTVLHFGNRAAIKGTLDLVRAAAALPAGSVRVILAGAEVEPGFDACLTAVAGDLELEIHGEYAAAELRRLARRADLAAFPSRAAESYGLVVEEALALGLPVWVSDRGALPEVLTSAASYGALPGGVLPGGAPERWSALLRELVEDPERLQDARCALPARPRAAAEAARDLLEIYRELLQGASISGP